MRLSEAIQNAGYLTSPSVPELQYLTAAAARVRERWPDVDIAGNEREREALALKLRDKVERNTWDNTPLSFVIAAASAVFDSERRGRPDLSQARNFLYAEARASTSETFLSGLLRAYSENYVAGAEHTLTLAAALKDAAPRMARAGQLLLHAVPELLDANQGPDQLASRMAHMSDPYGELLRLGVSNPHGPGFMDLAHLALTERVRPHLGRLEFIDWYIEWLRPAGKAEARNTGAELAIEALIHPWLNENPSEDLRSYLVETLIELYGDPRIRSGGVWAGVSSQYIAVVHRWLTREDMRFFTGVVDAAQPDAMWPPRRDFWLKLYDEGRIDAAWAALSSKAFEYAREHLMRQDAKNAYTRVGFQKARQNTSLLIVKIGNKIMVDGCHSYRTHVFDAADPMAPKLFEEGYDCNEIKDAADSRRAIASKSHSSIGSWSRWVRDMINADVAWSERTRPYTKVFRPRPPIARYAPQSHHPASSYAHRRPVPNGSTSARLNLFSAAGTTRPSSDTRPPNPASRGTAPPQSPVSAGPVRATAAESTRQNSGGSVSLTQTRFPSLTDRMISYGPEAAKAVLAILEAPTGGRTHPRLSPKSREGLEWICAERGDLPRRLRNALEHFLNNLSASGVDLDALFAMPLLSAVPKISPPPLTAPQPEQTTAPDTEKFPPLPDTAEGRLELLRRHVDAIEEFGTRQSAVERRESFEIAVRRLRKRSPHLRPAEIGELQKLYLQLRQFKKEQLK